MITDCFHNQQWDLSDTETIFVQGVFALLKILIPVVIWVYTWKVCRIDRGHHRASLLGLDAKGKCLVSSIASRTRRVRGTSRSNAALHLSRLRVSQCKVQACARSRIHAY